MKYIIKLVVSSFVFSIMLNAQSLDDLIKESQVLIEQGELDSAEQKLLEVLNQDNLIAEAHYLLSRVAYKQSNLRKTGEHLRNAISNDAANEDYRVEYERIGELNLMMGDGNRKLSSGDYDAAIVKFEKVEEEYPDFAGAAFYIGITNLRLGEIKTAAANFRKALEISPGYAKARKALSSLADKTYNSGNQSFRRGDYDSAVADYELVLELAPDYYKAQFQLGAISTKLGDYNSAIERYKKTVEINPSYYKGWFALGLSYHKNGQIDKALEALTTSVEVHPRYAKAYAQIGTIHLQQKNYESAEQALNLAIQSDPSYSKPYIELGKIYVIQENWEEAVNTLITGTALNGKDYIAYGLLAQSHNALEQYSDAKEAAYKSLDIKGNYGAALFELGIAEVNLGNRTGALNAFEKARNDRAWRKPAEYEINKIKHPERYKN